MAAGEREEAFAQAMEFVRAQRRAGMSEDAIRRALEASGWTGPSLAELWGMLEPLAPPPPPPPPSPAPPAAAPVQQSPVRLGRAEVPPSLATGAAGGRRAQFIVLVRSGPNPADAGAYALATIRPYMASIVNGCQIGTFSTQDSSPDDSTVRLLAETQFVQAGWGAFADHDTFTDRVVDLEGRPCAVTTCVRKAGAETGGPLQMVALGSGQRAPSVAAGDVAGRKATHIMLFRIGALVGNDKAFRRAALEPFADVADRGTRVGSLSLTGGPPPAESAWPNILVGQFQAQSWGSPPAGDLFLDWFLDGEGYPVAVFAWYPARAGTPP
jgi:hypothetical protein